MLLDVEMLVQRGTDLKRRWWGHSHVCYGNSHRHLVVGLGRYVPGDVGMHGSDVRIHSWLLVVVGTEVQCRVSLGRPMKHRLL